MSSYFSKQVLSLLGPRHLQALIENCMEKKTVVCYEAKCISRSVPAYSWAHIFPAQRKVLGLSCLLPRLMNGFWNGHYRHIGGLTPLSRDMWAFDKCFFYNKPVFVFLQQLFSLCPRFCALPSPVSISYIHLFNLCCNLDIWSNLYQKLASHMWCGRWKFLSIHSILRGKYHICMIYEHVIEPGIIKMRPLLQA